MAGKFAFKSPSFSFTIPDNEINPNITVYHTIGPDSKFLPERFGMGFDKADRESD